MPGALLHLLQSDGAPARTKACWAVYREGSGQSAQYCTVLWTGQFAACLKVSAAPVAAVAVVFVQQANHLPVSLCDWALAFLHQFHGVRNILELLQPRIWYCDTKPSGKATSL